MQKADQPDEGLALAYRDAKERMQRGHEEAVRRTQAAMKVTSGWLAAAKAAAAQSVLEATRSECQSRVTRLLQAHADSGERSAERVAEVVRERFLHDLTAPGLEFFPTSGPESAALAVVAVRHAADFESFRDQLAADVAQQFRAILDARAPPPAPVVGPPTKGPGLRENRVVFALLVLTAVLSLGGISWLDLFRRALALQ